MPPKVLVMKKTTDELSNDARNHRFKKWELAVAILAFLVPGGVAIGVAITANNAAEEALLAAQEANELSKASNLTAEEIRKIAHEANVLSEKSIEKADEALEWAKTDTSVADAVSLQEAPSGFKIRDGESKRVVFNNSRVPIHKVWVEGTINKKPAKTPMWEVPSCEIYTLQSNFVALQVHFYDGKLHWTKTNDGTLFPSEAQIMPPREKNDGISPRPAKMC